MHIQLNQNNEFLRNLPQGNIEFGPNHYQPAASLTEAEAAIFKVHELVPADRPHFNPNTQRVVSANPVLVAGAWVQQWEVQALSVEEAEAKLASAKAEAWERIKAERDRRKVLGVKVGAHWYHSDDSSRIQQLSLFVMGAAVPAVQWKTLTLSPPPVFVTMTPAIAAGIFQGTAASDAAVFGAAETHRVAMEASDSPESYDIGSGWPASIEDEL